MQDIPPPNCGLVFKKRTHNLKAATGIFCIKLCFYKHKITTVDSEYHCLGGRQESTGAVCVSPVCTYQLPDQRRRRRPGRTFHGAAASTAFYRTDPPSAA